MSRSILRPSRYGMVAGLLWIVILWVLFGCGDDGGVQPKITPPTTLYVDAANGDDANPGTETRPFKTITKALSTAVGGSTVEVAPGTYVENIDFMGKDIALVARDPDPSLTMIDGGAAGSVVTFKNGESASAKLEGFTITNGSAENGGGILIVGGSTMPTIQGNVITQNVATDKGGGIYIGGGARPRIGGSGAADGNTIGGAQSADGNTASSGGGICIVGSSSPTVTNNMIMGNSVDDGAGQGWGGGVFISGIGSNPTIRGNTIQENQARPFAGPDGYGAGIYVGEGAMPLIGGGGVGEGNTIGDPNGVPACQAVYGGGICIRGAGTDPTIQGNTIVNNGACNSGGGIFVAEGAKPLIGGLGANEGNTIENNKTNAAGGGISVADSGTRPTIVGNTINGNYGGCCGGGGIEIGSSASAVIYGNTIENNTTSSSDISNTVGAGIQVGNVAVVLDQAGAEWPARNTPPCAEPTNTYSNNNNLSAGGPYLYHVRFNLGSDVCD